jgi:stearoyl-CoA desaturase (Delta-9 desaturase)
MYVLTGTAITAGYHRFYSHRTYRCNRVIQFFMLVFGASALQNSALSWVSDHRYHHRHTDQEADPYNINKGFFWAHVGWIYYKTVGPRTYANAEELKRDPLVMWQHRWYPALAVVVGQLLPLFVGYLLGRPWGCWIWGGLVRTVAVHHATFLINSVAHTVGRKNHSDATSARDSWWLPIFSFGEGYHNFHHTYPGDYRNGSAWYHWDPTKWSIQAMSLVGLAWDLRSSKRLTGASAHD